MANTMVNTSANTMFNREEKVNEMIALLKKYGHDAATDGCEKIYGIWEENKKALWELLSKDKTFKEGKIAIPTQDTLSADLYRAHTMLREKMRSFAINTETAYPNYSILFDYVDENDCLVSKRAVDLFADWGIKAVEGQKITKPCLKLFEKIGLPDYMNEIAEANAYERNGRKHYSDEYPSYEQWKAKFTDYCSVKTKNYNLYLSIDPIDYLTMSFGNSWASCHTIDPDNLRGVGGAGYHGQYRAGTISYMLDGVTMIGYWISNDQAEKPAYEPKVIRQTFHFDVDKGILVQGRLYPRDQENADDSLYKHLRLAVEKRLAELMGEPNKWLKKSGSASSNYSWIYTDDGSLHYRDYYHYPNPQLALLKSKQIVVEEASQTEEDEGKPKYEKQIIKIGYDAPCVHCGEFHGNTESLLCDDCRHRRAMCERCGCIIDLDEESYYEDGYNTYCSDCCETCHDCGELVPPNCNVQYIEGEPYCHDCLERRIDRGDITFCEYHEEYEYEDDHTYVENYGYVCSYGLQHEIDYGYIDWCDYHEQYEYRTDIEPVHDDPDDIDVTSLYCEDARDELGIVYCDECNEYFIQDFMNCLSDTNNLIDRNLCNSCYKEELEKSLIAKEAE